MDVYWCMKVGRVSDWLYGVVREFGWVLGPPAARGSLAQQGLVTSKRRRKVKHSTGATQSAGPAAPTVRTHMRAHAHVCAHTQLINKNPAWLNQLLSKATQADLRNKSHRLFWSLQPPWPRWGPNEWTGGYSLFMAGASFLSELFIDIVLGSCNTLHFIHLAGV